MNIETSTGLEKRQLEADELYDYVKRSGNLFSTYLKKYMADETTVEKRAKEIIEREKGNGEIEKINGVREDVEKLWADAKDDAEMELFRWGSVKEEMPKAWEIIKKQQAYQMYQQSKSINGKLLNKKQLYEFNNLSSLRYAEKVQKYLTSKGVENDKNKDSDKDGINNFEENINRIWEESKNHVTSTMERQFKREK